MHLGFVTVVNGLFDFNFFLRVWMIYIKFHAKILHITFQTFSRSKYTNRFFELLLRALGVQILQYYFEVVGLGVQILRSSCTPWRSSYFRGVQILQHYSEVVGPGGPNTSKYLDQGELFQGGPFFCDRPMAVSNTYQRGYPFHGMTGRHDSISEFVFITYYTTTISKVVG